MKGMFLAVAAIAAAVAATVAVSGLLPGVRDTVDFFLIVVVYYAVTRSRSGGIGMGALGGLVQDAFASQFLGFHAFVKTGVAYAVGGLGSRFMLNQPFPQFLALLLATLLDGALVALLSFMAGLSVAVEPGRLGRQALANSILGMIIYITVQRRAGRSGRL
jgi:rod shape-determining protein MreD